MSQFLMYPSLGQELMDYVCVESRILLQMLWALLVQESQLSLGFGAFALPPPPEAPIASGRYTQTV
jgi:hypothetical protein